MSCIITYKGNRYTQEQFKEYISSNKNEFSHIIASNKNVIDSFKRKMEGIDYVFSQSPELASIGTKAQYLQYLSTIFKTSKVKGIVYHGTDNKEQILKEGFKNNAELFEPDDDRAYESGELGYGYYFTTTQQSAKNYGEPLAVILNNPDITNETTFNLITNEKGIQHFVKTKEQIHILGSKQDIQGFKKFVNTTTEQVVDKLSPEQPIEQSETTTESTEVKEGVNVDNLTPEQRVKYYKQFGIRKENGEHITLEDIQGNPEYYQRVAETGIVASEKTIRDVASRMADRIGYKVRFESDRTADYKGKLKGETAYVNLAHATLDTPIHEILGHPIIRSIKNRDKILSYNEWVEINTAPEMQGLDIDISKEAYDKYVNWRNNTSKLYQNLLKELDYGRGKEILDRIKRDYNVKSERSTNLTGYNIYKFKEFIVKKQSEITKDLSKYEIYANVGDVILNDNGIFKLVSKEDFERNNKSAGRILSSDIVNNIIKNSGSIEYYSLEEQQEEALVELLGLMTAEKLDKVKDGKLISLLKRLLKEINSFIKSLLKEREIEIAKLPDNMTLGDIADLLAYSNSKLILPGYEVVYTTPDNQQFKTYAEASKHISELAKSVEDVDLSNIKVENELPDRFVLNEFDEHNSTEIYFKENGQWYLETQGDTFVNKEKITEEKAKKDYTKYSKYQVNLNSFIEKNKEYEQPKEIIEEWKKVNNIQYNPEEIYSRGQEFVSVVGAYSSFDTNLMMQNLLQHIEDNEKAGGKFAISAYTKPVEKQIGHLEGGGGKIKFKLYPQSNDILWAANTDVYSGSVWDASEKVNKDKKSELLGVSYTKYPSLQNINSVQPNLAAIVDNLAHHHNELGISLNGNNFRLEYDEDVPYTTKKIIDSINSILDQKYGKLVKPEISKKPYEVGANSQEEVNNYLKQGYKKTEFDHEYDVQKMVRTGIQPTQTNETLKESIENIRRKNTSLKENQWSVEPYAEGEYAVYTYMGEFVEGQPNFTSLEEANKWVKENKPKEKEYTSQALINIKISKLKEVAKKYPRTLIRSQVYRIGSSLEDTYFDSDGELMFQKVSGLTPKQRLQQKLSEVKPQSREARDNALLDLMFGIARDKNTVGDMLTPGGFQYLSDIAEVIKTKRNIGTGGNRSTFDIMTVDELASRNTTGIALKGIAANHTSHASLRQHYNLQLVNPIKFDGEELTSLSGKKASTEVILKGNVVKVLTGDNVARTVTRNFGEVSAAVVDIAKDPVAYFLNYTTETSDIFSLLLGVGLDPYTASCFVSQPIVLEAIRLSEQSSKPLLVTMRGMLKKLDINPNKVKAVNLNTQELSDAVGTTNITTSLQTDVLKSYVAYSTPSRDLGKLIRASSADRKGLEASVASGEVILSLIDSILSDAKFSINGASEMLNITGKNDMIAEFTEQGIRKPVSEILSQAFPFQAYVIARIKSIISANIDNRELTEPEINYVNKQVINFLLTDFDYFKSSDRKELIDNLPERLSRLQSQVNSNPVIKEYAGKLLSVFQAKAGDKRVPDGMDIITFNTLGRLTDEQVDAIKQTWTDLLDLPEDIEGLRTFANDLIKYSFFTTGLGYSMNGYGHLIPTDAFTKYIVDSKGNTTSDHLEKAIEVCKNYTPYSEIIIPQFVDQFYRHEYNNQVYVPRVSTEVGSKNVSSIVKDVIMIKPGSVDVDNLYTTNYETEYTPEGERTTITYLPKPFIALQKGKITTLYKPTQDMFTGAITYAKTYKLGITGLTNEYDINGIGSSNVGNPYDDATVTPNVVDNNTVIPTEKVAEDKRNECK